MLTSTKLRELDSIVNASLYSAFPAAQIEVIAGGTLVYSKCFGTLDPEDINTPTDNDTRFDLSSITMLFTVTAFMTMVEQGKVRLDQPVCSVLEEFTGMRRIAAHPSPSNPGELIEFYSTDSPDVNTCDVTFRHLLAHNSGLPAWLPLHVIEHEMRERRQPDRVIRSRLKEMLIGTTFAYPVGARVAFSDVGMILLGWAMERIDNDTISQIVKRRVLKPLSLRSARYAPLPCVNVSPTQKSRRWERRLCGEPADENALSLGGSTGHSGLFMNVHDLAEFGEMFRRGGSPVLQWTTITEMTRQHSEEDGIRRGLGFALHSTNPRASSYAFSKLAYGHLGFTGTSLWIDPARALTVAILTNHTYYEQGSDEPIVSFRSEFHAALADMLPAVI
jgi:CubicO group peptidase (beta-lactamase class C family)